MKKVDEPRVSQFLIEAIENLGANPSLSVADIPPFDSDNNTNALSNVISQMEKFANSDISEESYLKYAGASKDETQKLWAFAGRLLLLFHPATTHHHVRKGGAVMNWEQAKADINKLVKDGEPKLGTPEYAKVIKLMKRKSLLSKQLIKRHYREVNVEK